MKNSLGLLSAEVQARIDLPPIPIIKKDPQESNEYDIININMRQNPSDAASEMYKLNIVTFENGQPEEFLQLMKNFNIAVDGTGTATLAGKINYLRTMLHAEVL